MSVECAAKYQEAYRKHVEACKRQLARAVLWESKLKATPFLSQWGDEYSIGADGIPRLIG